MSELNEMETAIVESIKEATYEVFSTMLMLEVKNEDSFCQKENNISTDLISSLHFFGEKYMGKIAIFAYSNVSCDLAAAMLGMDSPELDEEVEDCMGEIVNMIAGGAKTKLEDTMGLLHLLTPWVIAGKHLTITSKLGEECALSIESQAQFSWLMTKFITGDKYFYIGVQQNQVPKRPTATLDLEKRVNELEEENARLKKEIEALKS